MYVRRHIHSHTHAHTTFCAFASPHNKFGVAYISCIPKSCKTEAVAGDGAGAGAGVGAGAGDVAEAVAVAGAVAGAR